jgi:GNAT superfamily N-acetyltransferase
MRFRQATLDDAPVIVGHRRAMFADMGHRDAEVLDAMAAAFHPWVVEKMRAGEYLGWFALDNRGAVVAGLGLCLMDWPPHLIGPGRRGNILNVYTQPEYRRQGIARTLMQVSLDWRRHRGIVCVILHASEEGRPLYEALGFLASNEMRMLLGSVTSCANPLRSSP